MSSLLAAPERLLVVAAGPLDADEDIGASVARWTDGGTQAWLVCATSGDADGSEPDADPLAIAGVREAEQRAAAAILGYTTVTFLHRPAGAVANDLALREQLVRLIRAVRPDTVAAPDPSLPLDAEGRIVEADRRAIGAAAIDAIGPAARPMAFPSLARSEGLAPWSVPRLLLLRPATQAPDLVAGPFGARKTEALREHASVPETVAAAIRRSGDRAERVREIVLGGDRAPDRSEG